MRVWRAVRAGLTVVVVVGLAMGGLALAQDDAAPGRAAPVPSTAYERILDLLAPLVDDGTLTEDQAAAVADRLADNLPAAALHRDVPPALARLAEHLEEAVAAGELTQAEAEERLAEARERLARRAAHRSDRRDHLSDVLVDELGLTPARLREAAEAGDSLADVAAAQGVAPEDLVDRLVAPLEERLGGAVAEGHLTEEEAEARLAEAHEHVSDRVARPIRDRPRDRPRDR